jgi:hypothetical protein
MSRYVPFKTTLAETMPYEFTGAEYQDTPAYKLKDERVAAVYSLSSNEETAKWKPWPGKEKYVYFWVLLVNGKAVGFNENPSRGWSFPVVGPAAISRVL